MRIFEIVKENVNLREQTLSPAQLVPVYHRLSQAERERLEREQAAQTPHPQ